MKTPSKPKATLVADKTIIKFLTDEVIAFRAMPKPSKDDYLHIKGRGAYAMYGIKHSDNQLVVLASEPTSSDFNKYCTAKAKADYCERYDQVVEYRDVGNSGNPKVTILCWELAND